MAARTRTVTGAGVIATVALVLIFGNLAFTEFVEDHSKAGTVWGWFLRILSWPNWALGPRDGSNAAMRDLLSDDLRALLLVVFVGVVLGLVSRSVSGGAGGFFLGWLALIFASVPGRLPHGVHHVQCDDVGRVPGRGGRLGVRPVRGLATR